MIDTIRLARTDTFEHTISGLLKKRADLFNEASQLRDRIAEIRNDIDALDRVLGSLGYKGDLDAAMPRQKRNVVFGKGELTRAIANEIRLADSPMTSREIAQSIVSAEGMDKRDRKFVTDVTRRVSKALRIMSQEGRVSKAVDAKGNLMWARKRH